MYNQGKMNSRKRIYTSMELKEPDRVPILPSTRAFGIHYLGYTLADCYKDADKYIRSQMSMVTDFAVDAVWDLAGMNPIERALGQKMLDSEDDAPSPLEPFIACPEDLKNLPGKLELTGRGWTDYLVGINKKLKDKAGENIPVIGHIASPFQIATKLRGTQNLYMDLYERPDFVKELVEYLIEPVYEYAGLLVDAGADIIYTSCPTANRQMISRDHYKGIVHPVHERVFDYLKNKLSRKILFHVCGDWSDRLDLVVEEGPDIIHVDKIDLAWLKKEFGSRVTINGNVGSTTTLLLGSPEEVKKEAIDCIKKAGSNGGFLLGADCMVARDTPAENMKALTEAVMEAGYYPLAT